MKIQIASLSSCGAVLLCLLCGETVCFKINATKCPFPYMCLLFMIIFQGCWTNRVSEMERINGCRFEESGRCNG